MMTPVRKFVALATAWSAIEIRPWCSVLSEDKSGPKGCCLRPPVGAIVFATAVAFAAPAVGAAIAEAALGSV
jgi:hypothetical protein